jgi:hypothetical protein
MEFRTVNEVFDVNGVTYKVVEGGGCDDCEMCNCFMDEVVEVIGECTSEDRRDGVDVHFKKLSVIVSL